jgi:hypothetical protein
MLKLMALQKKAKEAAVRGDFAAAKKYAAEVRKLQQKKK